MDNLTHTLFGATLARAVPGRARGTTTALLLASNAPDIDIVAAWGGTLDYLAWHRGPTHGPLGIGGLGLVVAGLVWAGQRVDRTHPGERARFRGLVLASVAGVLCHVLMDLPTSYGTRLLSPFDARWFAIDLMPIVDVYLLAVLALGLLLASRNATSRRRWAIGVLGLMLANYGLRAVAHERALAVLSRAAAPFLPEPCPDRASGSFIDSWSYEDPYARRDRSTRRCLVATAAIPTFLSPFRWQTIIRLSDSYRTAPVDLFTSPSRSAAADTPVPAHHHVDQWTPAAVRAAEGRVGRVFLDFSRFPATSINRLDESRVVVRWIDLRFVAPPASGAGRRAFFTAHAVVDRSGEIVEQALGP